MLPYFRSTAWLTPTWSTYSSYVNSSMKHHGFNILRVFQNVLRRWLPVLVTYSFNFNVYIVAVSLRSSKKEAVLRKAVSSYCATNPSRISPRSQPSWSRSWICVGIIMPTILSFWCNQQLPLSEPVPASEKTFMVPDYPSCGPGFSGNNVNARFDSQSP